MGDRHVRYWSDSPEEINLSDSDDEDHVANRRREINCAESEQNFALPSTSTSVAVNPVPSTSTATENCLLPVSKLLNGVNGDPLACTSRPVAENQGSPTSRSTDSPPPRLSRFLPDQAFFCDEIQFYLNSLDVSIYGESSGNGGRLQRRRGLWAEPPDKKKQDVNHEAEISFLYPFMRNSASTTSEELIMRNGTESPTFKQNSSKLEDSALPSTSKSADSALPSTSKSADSALPSTSKSADSALPSTSKSAEANPSPFSSVSIEGSISGSPIHQPGVENQSLASDSVDNSDFSSSSKGKSGKHKSKRKHCEEIESKTPAVPKEEPVKKSLRSEISPTVSLPTGNTTGGNCNSMKKQDDPIPLSHEEARVENARHAVLNHPDYMEPIFKSLKLTEQNSFRLVCKSWYEMAHGFWCKSAYNCDNDFEKPEDLEKVLSYIKKRPLLKKIVCSFKTYFHHFKVVDTVLKQVDDVHHLELQYVTPTIVADIVKKYVNLKSLVLDRGSLHILTCMNLITQFSDLERLEFTSNFDHMNNDEHYAKVCEIIADNFPKLQHLSLVPVKDAETVKNATVLLSEKFECLLSLKLECYLCDEDMYSLVNMCDNLEKLDLTLHSPTLPFELCNLSRLTDLKLVFDGAYSKENVMHTFTSLLMAKPRLENLRFELLNEKFDLGVFELICQKFNLLETLYLWNVDPKIMDYQLKNIGDLKKLTNLTVFGADITEAGSKYIKMCGSLKSLTLMNCKITESALKNLALSSSLEVIQISFTPLTVNTVLEFVSLTSNMKKINFTACNLNANQKEQIYHKLEKDIESRGYILMLG